MDRAALWATVHAVAKVRHPELTCHPHKEQSNGTHHFRMFITFYPRVSYLWELILGEHIEISIVVPVTTLCIMSKNPIYNIFKNICL